MNANKKKKILLIGWDAADWKVINPMLDAGLLPCLNALVNNSTISNLATLDPPLSPMLWTSIATGKRPYKHGIIGFTETDAGGEKIIPVTNRNRKCKAVWNILSEHDYKTHVVGWWPSHPAENINGIAISDFYQKSLRPVTEPWLMKAGTVSPEEKAGLFAEMRVHPSEITEQHIAAFVPDFKKTDQQKDKSLQTLAKIIAENASIHAAATYILENEEWDFLAVYYDGIDHFNHGFMKFHPPKREYVSDDHYHLYKDVVTSAYRYHDLMLSRLLQLAGDDCTVLLVSDHGFHPDHLRKQLIPADLAGPAAEHSPYGIFCVKGEGIKKDEIIYGSSVLDITPTILAIAGLAPARDMDGKVLSGIFTDYHDGGYVESWDNEKHFSPPPVNDIIADEETLQQLSDLGYINLEGKKSAPEMITDENNFFLARSYMDGGKYAEALPLLENLQSKKPFQPRVCNSLCECYHQLLNYEKVTEIIRQFKEHLREKKKIREGENTSPENRNFNDEIPPGIRLMEATLLTHQNKISEALSILHDLMDRNGPSGKVNLKAGVCYGLLNDWHKAKQYFLAELGYNYDEPEAHHGLGYCLMKQNKFSEATDSFLNAIGLRFNYPVAHYHLGECFYFMNKFSDALQSYQVCLEMEPGLNKARLRIAELTGNSHGKKNASAGIKEILKENHGGIIFIVSGLPRSGTSLMMQMLSRGGMGIFTDGKRQPDENNPKGYFEHEAVLNLRNDASWLRHAAGKAVKIVSPLLGALPPLYRYRIIYMERALNEVMRSQQTMLISAGKSGNINYSLNVFESYRQTSDKVMHWAKNNSGNVDLLRVNYTDLLSDPQAIVPEIIRFTGKDLDASKMMSAIDRNLYRNKTALA